MAGESPKPVAPPVARTAKPPPDARVAGVNRFRALGQPDPPRARQFLAQPEARLFPYSRRHRLGSDGSVVFNPGRVGPARPAAVSHLVFENGMSIP